jgi:hypothetical protein
MAPAKDSALEIRLVPLSQGQSPTPAQAQPVSATKIVSRGELEAKASRFEQLRPSTFVFEPRNDESRAYMNVLECGDRTISEDECCIPTQLEHHV